MNVVHTMLSSEVEANKIIARIKRLYDIAPDSVSFVSHDCGRYGWYLGLSSDVVPSSTLANVLENGLG